jgi:hypothetical protein
MISTYGYGEKKFTDMWPHLNERQRLYLATSQAKTLGHGGITTIK